MSRRDTILVAVFINMGILVVLFLGGLKPHSAASVATQKLAAQTEIKQK